MNDSTCRWPECERPARTRTYCQRDYYRAKTEGNFVDPWLTWVDKTHVTRAGRGKQRSNDICAWPECAAMAKSNRMCLMHYGRAFRLGNLTDPWLTWQQYPKCATCGTAFQATRTTQRYCSARCNLTEWNSENIDRVRELSREHTRRRRARMLSTQVEKFTDKDVRLATGDDCYLCGERINFRLKFPHPKSPSVDHVIPLARGGSHTLGNVAMTHILCNQKKNVRATARVPQPTMFAL